MHYLLLKSLFDTFRFIIHQHCALLLPYSTRQSRGIK